MKYEIQSANGRVRTIDARDWMNAMCIVVAEERVEVTGWMCFNRPDGKVEVIDPNSGGSWLVTTLGVAAVPHPVAAPAPTEDVRVHPRAVPVQSGSIAAVLDSVISPEPSPVPPTPVPGADVLDPPKRLQPQRALSFDLWRPPAGFEADLAAKATAPEANAPEDLAERLFELSSGLVSAGSPNAAARMALDILMELVPCEAGSVLRGSHRVGELTFVACSGPAAKKLIGQKMPLEQGVVGATVDLGISIEVHDVSRDDRYLDKFDKQTGFQTRSVACVPIRAQHAVYGAVELINPKVRFQPWHISAMESVSRHLAPLFAG